MFIQQLPPSTIKLISSTQVITSVSSVIKELIENAIDAGATNIEVKLENHGLDKIEVRDNGMGVKREEIQYMCKKSYTSKIKNFDDLYKLSTYGFRGEALNSLCALATVTITTISEGEDVAMTYAFDHDGNIKSNKISHIIKGTTVLVENLFKNLPVRKQFLTNGRRKMDEIKKVEQVVKTLAVIHPRLRVVLTHNKFCIWQKNCVSTLRQSLVQIIAPTIVKQLTDIKYESDTISFDLLVPARACNIASTCYGNPGDATYLFINSRPIKNKIIEKIVQDEIFSYFGHEVPSGKYPTCLVSIKLPPDSLDVNLEPNKTRVIIKDIEEIGNILKKELVLYYIGPIETPKEFHELIDEEIERNCIKRKNDDHENIGKKSKLESIGKVEFMTERDYLDDCDQSDVKLINKNIVMNEEVSLTIRERNSNETSLMEGIVEGNSEIPVETEINMSAVNVAEVEKSLSAEAEMTNSENNNSVENSLVANTDINIDKITLSQWSRGDVHLGDNLIKSSTVLLDCKNIEKENVNYFNNQVNSDLCLVDETGITSQVSSGERSVSSQMGCKDMAGFTKYASEAISKISKSGDNTNFTKVASELASKWREMNDIDKDSYLEKAKKKQKEKETKEKVVMRERLQQFLEKCNEKRALKKRTYHTEIDLDINMESLKISVNKRMSDTELGFRFLGELNEDLKCVAIAYDLYIFSTRRLQEALLYYKNVQTMIIPVKVLESGITVKKDDLGESLWSVLVSMETAIDVKCGAVIISDERISRNGFRIELVKGDLTGYFIITDVPLHIAFFGLEDLKEILSLIETSSPELPLEDCRPLKILSYIRGETIRFISKNDVDIESDRVLDEFRYWLDHIKPKSKRCPHQKAVFKRIDLKDFIK